MFMAPYRTVARGMSIPAALMEWALRQGFYLVGPEGVTLPPPHKYTELIWGINIGPLTGAQQYWPLH